MQKMREEGARARRCAHRTTVGSHGPSWTGGGVDRKALGRGGMLIGAGPSATLGHRSSLAGSEKGERSMGVPSRASPGFRQWYGGRTIAWK
jgi:hypothetical protein